MMFTLNKFCQKSETDRSSKRRLLTWTSSTSKSFREECRRKEDRRNKKLNSGKGSWKRENSKGAMSCKSENNDENVNLKNGKRRSGRKEKSGRGGERRNWTSTSRITERN
jgi:hypothetical protein